jgi:hypothetical protein
MSAEEQSRAEIACARWIYSAGLPLSITEQQSFKDFMKTLRPAFKPPSRTSLSQGLLDTVYDGLQQQVTSKLAVVYSLSSHPFADEEFNL